MFFNPKKIFWLIITLILTAIITRFFICIRYIPDKNVNMYPTLQGLDRMIICKSCRNFQRGDIVTYKSPLNNKLIFIKRIIALPGEKYEFKVNDKGDGIVYINDEPLNEPYIENPKLFTPCNASFITCGPVIVPDNSYMMVGDNRENSLDSRMPSHGFVTKDKIEGKAVYLFYPFERRKKL